MDSSLDLSLRNSEMYYFIANIGSTAPVRSPQRHRNRRNGLMDASLPYAGANQGGSTFSTHRRLHNLPDDTQSGTLGMGPTTTPYEDDVTRWTFQFPGTLFDGEAKEEASRLADVAATIFIQPAENTPTSVEAPVSAPTTMDMSQAVAASNTDGMPVVNMVAKKVDTPPVMVTPTRECLICTEKYEGDEVLKVQFPFDCGRCGKNAYCAACISKWFLDACRNESRMPPKCCYAIPITTVSDLLNPGQIKLFDSKHEEWMTADRMYCPIPSCSAFIPPRLLRAASKQNTSPPTPPPECEVKQDATEVDFEDKVDMVVSSKVIVCCPDCHTKVCASCRAVSHLGDCVVSDIDPELKAALERWKIKRCPKCRTGLRRMYGCNHVECHCGAHFCYACLRPSNECDGECGEDDDEDFDDVAEDDLDGKEDWGDGRNIGEEPMHDDTDMWGCRHRFRRMVLQTARLGHVECQRCYKSLLEEMEVVTTTEDGYVDGLTVKSKGDVVMTGTGETAEAENEAANHGWTCACGRTLCADCKELEDDE